MGFIVQDHNKYDFIYAPDGAYEMYYSTLLAQFKNTEDFYFYDNHFKAMHRYDAAEIRNNHSIDYQDLFQYILKARYSPDAYAQFTHVEMGDKCRPDSLCARGVHISADKVKDIDIINWLKTERQAA